MAMSKCKRAMMRCQDRLRKRGKDGVGSSNGSSSPRAPVLQRTAFSTSRMMEFFTEKELRMQLGMDRWHWPVALTKELIDNALDACEVAGVAPQITVTVTDHTLAVADNGAGLPQAVLERSLDYLVRVSDKAYYISPTRGQLGNALKAVWAAPFVVSGTEGRIDVQTAAYALTVRVQLDRIAQKPMMTVEPLSDGIVQNRTTITLHWPGIASEIAELEDVCLYNSEGAGSLCLQALLEGMSRSTCLWRFCMERSRGRGWPQTFSGPNGPRARC